MVFSKSLLYKKIIKKVKMAGDCGLNALSLLPENEQVQYLQKIALRAENPSGHNYCHKKGPPDVLSSGSLFCAGVDSYRITLES